MRSSPERARHEAERPHRLAVQLQARRPADEKELPLDAAAIATHWQPGDARAGALFRAVAENAPSNPETKLPQPTPVQPGNEHVGTFWPSEEERTDAADAEVAALDHLRDAFRYVVYATRARVYRLQTRRAVRERLGRRGAARRDALHLVRVAASVSVRVRVRLG